MAIKFEWENMFDSVSWIVLYPNAQGYQDKFLALCADYLKQSDFPNIEHAIDEFKTGGMFFNKEVTRMLGVNFTKSQFSKLGIFFRAQQFGNIVYYSLLTTVDKGFWDTVRGKGLVERYGEIRSKCKNLAQWEEFSTLSSFGDHIFANAMQSLDPKFMENKSLHATLGDRRNRS